MKIPHFITLVFGAALVVFSGLAVVQKLTAKEQGCWAFGYTDDKYTTCGYTESHDYEVCCYSGWYGSCEGRCECSKSEIWGSGYEEYCEDKRWRDSEEAVNSVKLDALVASIGLAGILVTVMVMKILAWREARQRKKSNEVYVPLVD